MSRRSLITTGAFTVVIAERRLKRHAIFKADQLPADVIAIAAIAWVAEEAIERVSAKQLEEVGSFYRMNQLDLLRAWERRDARRVREQFFALLLHGGHARTISFTLVR